MKTQNEGEKLTFQENFVSLLKSTVPSNISLADELADLLNVSNDSIYRRLRCQSSFSADEIALISRKFGISLDGLLDHDTLQVSFSFTPLFDSIDNFGNYLQFFCKYLTDLTNVAGSRIIYAADDVPVIRHFNYPTISAFKSYYWSKVVLNVDLFGSNKFNPNIVPKEILELNKKTYQAYSKIERVEIWTEETLTSTLKQVDFFWESGFFEHSDFALQVISEIRVMMDDLKGECEESQNAEQNNKSHFALYISDLMIGNNSVLIEPGNSKFSERVFLGHNTFNTISTYNAAFRKETKAWLDNLIKKSMLVSGSGEKQRTIFFRKMEAHILQLEQKLQSAVAAS